MTSDEKLDLLIKKIDNLETSYSNLETNLQDIKLTLENETNRNIQIIAEGHMNISRKLDEALQVENEKEMLLVRVNTIENELRKIKEKIGA